MDHSTRTTSCFKITSLLKVSTWWLLRHELYSPQSGYHVLGVDYFLGDPLGNHTSEPDFDLIAWITKSRTQAREVLPKWIAAVRAEYGATSKYTAVGYCFGGPYSIEAAATDWISAAAFAHPADVTEAHVTNVTSEFISMLEG
jgi:dienelactone hydrolase